MWLQLLRLGERKSDEYLLHYRCYCRGGHRGAVLWDRVNVRKFVVYHGEAGMGWLATVTMAATVVAMACS
jgi:hypothetical protein